MSNISQLDIKSLFNKLAKKYDYMNNIISFFTHKQVRKIAIKDLNITPNSKVLDLCCGTGDFGALVTGSSVVGVDNSYKMLEIARQKNPNIIYLEQDATELQNEDNSFDYVIMSFGLRNIVDREKALKEVYRVLKTGGYFLHLDFGKNTIINKIYNNIILLIIRFFIKDVSPYEYLVESKNNFLSSQELIQKFSKLGFSFVKQKSLVLGIIAYQIMQKK